MGSSARALAKETGLHYTHVTELIRTYSESPPALRGLSATGVSVRGIVELQPVFGDIFEGKQARLAGKLEGISKREAKGIGQMVDGGASPLATAISGMADANKKVSSTRSKKKEAGIPSPEADKELRRIAG